MTPHVADIQAAVCRQYHIAPIEMTSHRNGQAAARVRQLAMYLARELTPLSLPAIGRQFGDREHSTVIHACRVTEQRIKADREFANIVARLRFRIAHPDQPPLPLDEA
jgi:chromosomal replication initiator protein